MSRIINFKEFVDKHKAAEFATKKGEANLVNITEAHNTETSSIPFSEVEIEINRITVWFWCDKNESVEKPNAEGEVCGMCQIYCEHICHWENKPANYFRVDPDQQACSYFKKHTNLPKCKTCGNCYYRPNQTCLHNPLTPVDVKALQHPCGGWRWDGKNE